MKLGTMTVLIGGVVTSIVCVEMSMRRLLVATLIAVNPWIVLAQASVRLRIEVRIRSGSGS